MLSLSAEKKSQRRRQSMTHNSSTVEQFKIKVNCDTFPVNRLHTFRTVHLTIELWKIVFSFLQMNEGLHTQTCRKMSFHSQYIYICMRARSEVEKKYALNRWTVVCCTRFSSEIIFCSPNCEIHYGNRKVRPSFHRTKIHIHFINPESKVKFMNFHFEIYFHEKWFRLRRSQLCSYTAHSGSSQAWKWRRKFFQSETSSGATITWWECSQTRERCFFSNAYSKEWNVWRVNVNMPGTCDWGQE